MVDNFTMTITTEDMLRLLNNGIRDYVTSIGKLVEHGDRVARIQYSRDTKRYTLVFESGRRIKVLEAQKAANAKFVGDVLGVLTGPPATQQPQNETV